MKRFPDGLLHAASVTRDWFVFKKYNCVGLATEYVAYNLDIFCFIWSHREHTILLNRERVNIGTKWMNSLPLSLLVISFILRDIYWENCCLQILRNTEALNSSSELGKKNFCLYKIWQGRQLFDKTFWTHCEYSLESLNFVAFMKPNKHKWGRKVFLQLGRICFRILLQQSGPILASFTKFCLSSLSVTWSYRYPNPKHVIQRALALPSLSHTCGFDTRNLYKPLPWFVVFLTCSKSADLCTEAKLP